MDKQKRIPLLREVYKTIAADAPYAFLFNDQYALYAHSSRIKMAKPSYKFSVGTDYWSVENK
jgi:peptide/nickel transport system substrate-binding protein/microcin C transport system substrate-binding protein